MSYFEQAFQRNLVFEGGYSNDPSDHGGATNMGVTLQALRDFRHDPSLVAVDVQRLTVEEASRIYKQNYWDKLSLDSCISGPIATAIFDQCVNRGPHAAAVDAQTILNQMNVKVTIDGVLGPKTWLALNNVSATKFVIKFAQKTMHHYVDIIKGNPSQLKWLGGWTNRAMGLLDLI